ncbi:MAG: hypothetical protein ABL952_11840, partial [Pyrinomonadaceae bacterium]
VKLAPNSVVSFSVSNTGMIGEIIAGEITTFSDSLSIKTIDGSLISPKFGDTVSPTGVVKSAGDDERDSTGKCIDKDGDGKLECDDGLGAGFYLPLFVAAAVAVATVYIGMRESDSSPVVSPNR